VTDASRYLLEIGAHDGTNPLTLRVSSANFGGFMTGPNDTPADTFYPDGIIDPGYVSRHLFAEGRTLGRSEVGYGDIVISNASGAFDGWLNYGFDGRAVVLKRLASPRAPFASAQTLLRATMTRLDSTDAYRTMRLRLYDRRLELDKPFQQNRYAGTTLSAGATAEGTADMKGRVKPRAYGYCDNVPVPCVNPFNLIYQVNDGPVAGIAVYDGGAPLIFAGNHANLAALTAAAVLPGRFITCVALGLFKLGSVPAKLVTADIAEASTLDGRSAANIAIRMLASVGLTGAANVNASSFNTLFAANPAELGIYIDSERTTLDVVSEVLASVGAWIVPSTAGVFEVGRLSAPGTPTFEIGKYDIHTDGEGSFGIVSNPDTVGGLPAFRINLTYGRNWQVQDDGGLAACVSADRRGFLAVDRRTIRVDNTALLTKHPLASELTIDTLLRNASEATVEANRRAGLYGTRRDVVTLSARRDDYAAAQLGATGTLKLNRLGYQAGRNMVVIGRREDPANERVDLTLWG
jgi:hypothetical protein